MSAERTSDSKVTIKIPRILYNRLAEIVSGSGFNSVTDFVIYVLRDLASARNGVNPLESKDEKELSKEEIEAVRKRLKTLGYL
jgi:hypothetical protein